MSHKGSNTKGMTAMSENINTDLAIVADADKALAGLTGKRQEFMTTFDTSTNEGQDALFMAMTDSVALSDHLGVPFDLVGYSAQIVEFNNEEGVKQEGIRMILTAADGTSFSTMSDGVTKAVKTLVGVYGDPSGWAKAKRVKAVEEGKKPRAYLTLKPVAGK